MKQYQSFVMSALVLQGYSWKERVQFNNSVEEGRKKAQLSFQMISNYSDSLL